MTRTVKGWTVAAAVLVAIATLSAADVKVTPVISDGKVFASFTAPTALSTDSFEMVKSGIQLTLTFLVELRRPSTFFLDRTLGTSTLAASVKYDTLTHVYQVSKQQDGRVVWSDRTEQEDEMRGWVTSFEKILVDAGEPLEPNVEYYVQVRLRTTPRRGIFLLPFTRDDAIGRKDFTFIR
jgi:hypothetical protein